MKTILFKYKNLLISESTGKRFIAIFFAFFGIFYSSTILSHLFLPEGILRGKTSGGIFETSANVWVSALQIFSWNMISVVVLLIANLFAYRKNEDEPFISYGILSMIVWATIDGVTLGTNSFAIQRENMDIVYKLFSTLDLKNRAGLWELVGLNFIGSVLQQKAFIFTTNKTTKVGRIFGIKYTRLDILFFIIGIVLMIVGAFVESSAILNIAQK